MYLYSNLRAVNQMQQPDLQTAMVDASWFVWWPTSQSEENMYWEPLFWAFDTQEFFFMPHEQPIPLPLSLISSSWLSSLIIRRAGEIHRAVSEELSAPCKLQLCTGRNGNPTSAFAAEFNTISNYCLRGHYNLQS